MKSPKYITPVLVSMLSLALVPMSHAEHFRSTQSLTTESNNANFTKHRNEPSSVSGRTEAKGIGLFTAGSKEQEVVLVSMNGDFEGKPDSLKSRNSELLSFGDGSTIKLELEGQSQGKRVSAKVVSAEGTGRFKGIKIDSASLNGNALDPSLNYVEIEGDYELP
jgi:hypothetical protein